MQSVYLGRVKGRDERAQHFIQQMGLDDDEQYGSDFDVRRWSSDELVVSISSVYLKLESSSG